MTTLRAYSAGCAPLDCSARPRRRLLNLVRDAGPCGRGMTALLQAQSRPRAQCRIDWGALLPPRRRHKTSGRQQNLHRGTCSFNSAQINLIAAAGPSR